MKLQLKEQVELRLPSLSNNDHTTPKTTPTRRQRRQCDINDNDIPASLRSTPTYRYLHKRTLQKPTERQTHTVNHSSAIHFIAMRIIENIFE